MLVPSAFPLSPSPSAAPAALRPARPRGSARMTARATTLADPTAAEPVHIRVGHSPDPDDAFMFHALANDKIPTPGYRFTHDLVDIETLNRRALEGDDLLELTAVSLHGMAHLTDKYAICNCGASMGDGYGPRVVAREPWGIDDLRGKRIAVPGTLTTAFLSLKLILGTTSSGRSATSIKCSTWWKAASSTPGWSFTRDSSPTPIRGCI